MTEKLIEFQNIALRFGKQIVHRNISFSINAGEAITILGPSGSGKTLLLKMILGLIEPDQGEVFVFGHALSSLSENDLKNMRSKIGMLFQGAALFDSLNVYENVAYALREQNILDEKQIAERVADKLQLIGLPGIESKYPSQLSGGQKKRVALARALASEPKVLLFDEPTTGLDPTSTRMIDDLIIKLNCELNITCIAVTHDIASSKRFSTRWVLINNGEIVADGPVSELLNQSSLVKDFVQGNWV